MDFFLNGKSIRMIDSEGQADIFFQSQGIEEVKILKNKAQPFPAETRQFTGGYFRDIFPRPAGYSRHWPCQWWKYS